MNHSDDPAVRALQAWDWSNQPTISVNNSGLINRTLTLSFDGQPTAILQQLNTSIFIPEVNEDIDAITSHLAAKNLRTPRLIRTSEGGLWHTDPEGRIWRCLTYEGNRTADRPESPKDAWEAASFVAQFHSALVDCDWEFRSIRDGAHDTAKHMNLLVTAMQTHSEHRLRGDVESVADKILEQWSRWEGREGLPQQMIHGDLKFSNIRFMGPHAHCLIDLDTLACSTFDIELGDAMRSWCNCSLEDSAESQFSLSTFSAAIHGYRDGLVRTANPRVPSEDEWNAIVFGTERIALELAARFARDSLEERYFGWDSRFGSRGEHCLLRARGQLSLAQSVRDQRCEAQRIIENRDSREA
ncbi:MAG: phosphotransferase [Polyangiaceae bacterium]|nr:phosphotransferase [Polyangiaceae bacterium]